MSQSTTLPVEFDAVGNAGTELVVEIAAPTGATFVSPAVTLHDRGPGEGLALTSMAPVAAVAVTGVVTLTWSASKMTAILARKVGANRSRVFYRLKATVNGVANTVVAEGALSVFPAGDVRGQASAPWRIGLPTDFDRNSVDAHAALTAGAHSAGAITLADAGNHWTATTVEGALAEVPSRYVAQDGTITTVVKMTQAAYDALGTKDATTLYITDGVYVGGTGLPAPNDPLGWGVPVTSALLCGNMSVGSIAANNYNWFSRVIGGGTITKIGIVVGTQSGNICVGVVRPTGTGTAAVPVTRLATSGSVSCPATGYQEVSLGGSVTVKPGDYFVLTADNTTATFQRGVLFSGSSNIFRGSNYVSSTDGFPIAATITGAVAAGDRSFAMVGVA